MEEIKGFDTNKFMTTDFKDRTADIPVPSLKKFFPEDAKPVWTVKCLTANEIATANDAVNDNNEALKEAVLKLIGTIGTQEKTNVVNDVSDIKKDMVNNEIVKRISMLVSGSVSPVCSQEMAVKIAENYSAVFYQLTNKLFELIGQGRLGE